MTNAKSTITTALVAGMLAFILCTLWQMKSPVFPYLLGVLALIGYAAAALLFCRWLSGAPKQAKAEMLPPKVARKPVGVDPQTDPQKAAEGWQPDEVWTGDYDAIRAEVKAEEGAV